MVFLQVLQALFIFIHSFFFWFLILDNFKFTGSFFCHLIEHISLNIFKTADLTSLTNNFNICSSSGMIFFQIPPWMGYTFRFLYFWIFFCLKLDIFNVILWDFWKSNSFTPEDLQNLAFWGLELSICDFSKLFFFLLQNMYFLLHVVFDVSLLLSLWSASGLTRIFLNVWLPKEKKSTAFLNLLEAASVCGG